MYIMWMVEGVMNIMIHNNVLSGKVPSFSLTIEPSTGQISLYIARFTRRALFYQRFASYSN